MRHHRQEIRLEDSSHQGCEWDAAQKKKDF